MFNEYDVVRSRKAINEKIDADYEGVIVMVLDAEKGVYEVEFFDENDVTIDVTEVTSEQIKKGITN